MSNYTKTTDFQAKDSLPTGNANKVVKGAEIDTEFNAIATAIATKANTASPTFTGTMTAATATFSGNVTLGDAATDTVTVNSDVASNLIPSADSTYALGDSSNYWSNAYVDAVTTTGNVSVGGNLTVTGNATISGTLTFGDADTDSITLNAEIASDVIPDVDGTYDLGSAAKEWQDLYIDGTANIDSLVADTADINSGTIDNTVIGGTTAVAGTFTTATATTGAITTVNSTTVNATTVDSTNVEVTNIKAKDGTASASIADSTGVMTVASAVLTTADINGGSIDNATIGATTASTGNFSTLSIGGTAITATAAELNTLDGITATVTELNYTDGVTSNIQTQLDAKQALDADLTAIAALANTDGNFIVGNGTTWVTESGDTAIFSLGITATASELNTLDGITATVTELNYVDGVTSAIQTQLDAKAPIDAATFTGTTTIPTADINGGTIDGVTIGGSTAAAGTFTTFTSTGIDDNASSTAITIDSSQNATFAGDVVHSAYTKYPANTAAVLTTGGDAAIFGGTSAFPSAVNGNLVLQSRPTAGAAIYAYTGATPTLAMTIDGSQNVTFAGETLTLGDSSTFFSIYQAIDSQSLGISGGNAYNVGANAFFYGSTHATRANDIRLRYGGTDVIEFDYSAQSLILSTSGSEAMRIDSGGDVGIGTSSPSYRFHAANAGAIVAEIQNTSSTADSRVRVRNTQSYLEIGQDGSGGYIQQGGAYPIIFYANSAERMRIDSSGSVGIGKTSATSFATAGVGIYGDATYKGTIEGTTDGVTCMNLNRLTNDGTLIGFYQATVQEGTISVSGTTVSYNGGHLARWTQMDSDNGSLLKGTVMTNLDDMCVWKQAVFTTQHLVSEAVDAVEAVAEIPEELDDEGNVIQEYVPAVEAVEAKDAVYEDVEHRETYEGDAADGDVIDFEFEGQTYSATVVFEDNEQLNKMEVSSVEGDANVAGVFVSYDDDGDINIAMTGDMVIRIAQGTTVARGDLLMSAGDGTAKPQDDDIVRAKTIAKVTSTHVSHTYDDGSYLVPCVLMAC